LADREGSDHGREQADNKTAQKVRIAAETVEKPLLKTNFSA
jgi:hypothetical protein